jgi:hypothetical protein
MGRAVGKISGGLEMLMEMQVYLYGGEDCQTDPCLSPGGGLITRKLVTSHGRVESSIKPKPTRN